MRNTDAQEKPPFLFLIVFRVQDMIFRQTEPIEFVIKKTYKALVAFTRTDLEEKEAPKNQFFLRVYVRRHLSKDVNDFLEKVSDGGEFPESSGALLDVTIRGKNRGQCTSQKARGPQSYEQFITGLHQELSSLAEEVLSVTRWRVDAHGAHQPVAEVCQAFFSKDDKVFHELSLPIYLYSEVKRDIVVTEEQKSDIVSYVEKDISEPYAHRLFREAWNERLSSPRSALITGIAALEIGVKEMIADLVPDAKWFITNVPSPDVIKILQEGLQGLPTRLKIGGETVPPPPDVLKELKKAISMRNVLTHAGHGKVRRDKVHDILCLVRDVLSLLDYYRGHEWALCHISKDTLQKLPGIDENQVRSRIESEDRLFPVTAMVCGQVSYLAPQIN